MKDFINYYYHFYISDIHFFDEKYFFNYDGNTYMFENCTNVYPIIESIYELNQQLIYRNMYYHKIITNKDNSVITILENKPFVMLKLSPVKDMPITIFDIKGTDVVTINKKLEQLVRFNWTTLWENKIDYFENQLFTKKDKYGNLMDSFYYCVGMAENAILYIQEAMNNQKANEFDELVVSHKRFYKNMNLMDFYDPTTLIIDHRSRDVSEFLKCSFWSNDYDFIIIKNYLNKYKMSTLGAHLLFGRMLFPSFYFDYLEGIIFSGSAESMYWIEDRMEEYNMFLSDIFTILSEHFELKEVKWITKKM